MSICPICKHSDQTEGHSFTSAKNSALGIPIRTCPAIAEGSAYIHAGPGLTPAQLLATRPQVEVEPMRIIKIEDID